MHADTSVLLRPLLNADDDGTRRLQLFWLVVEGRRYIPVGSSFLLGACISIGGTCFTRVQLSVKGVAGASDGQAEELEQKCCCWACSSSDSTWLVGTGQSCGVLGTST